ncbi:MAG: hypothetical protein IPK44_01285 [Candidatus Accumulibacter sp.]|uniref:hypothetical protein n=1 Tax=Accumulibacter sp. TaxID=2053492 RepID=UPI00258FDBBD|nr:hypothetical protein [Accumulibacter sp.]MBK8113232.1 hypothetical protein [Accumulibacter sp.]
MAQTFDEMCKARDPLYAAMRPGKEFGVAVKADRRMAGLGGVNFAIQMAVRDAALLVLARRALRNQGQPHYDAR